MSYHSPFLRIDHCEGQRWQGNARLRWISVCDSKKFPKFCDGDRRNVVERFGAVADDQNPSLELMSANHPFVCRGRWRLRSPFLVFTVLPSQRCPNQKRNGQNNATRNRIRIAPPCVPQRYAHCRWTES